MNILKKFLFKIDYISPIVDKQIYEANANSTAGNSLSESNVLIYSQHALDKDIIDAVFKEENCIIKYIAKDKISVDDLKDTSASFVGNIDHIINVIYDEGNNILNNDQYNDNDINSKVYFTIKGEVNYLVPLNRYTTICTICFMKNEMESQIYSNVICNCISGLGKVLANHDIICNGVIGQDNSSMKEAMQTAAFLSSKYGQVMSGETISIK